jgi:hypothetical protein
MVHSKAVKLTRKEQEWSCQQRQDAKNGCSKPHKQRRAVLRTTAQRLDSSQDRAQAVAGQGIRI